MVTNFTRFLNVGIRSTTLAARFLFIFFLARYLDPKLVGYYGLFTATVGYALYFVGLDFYTYASREIVKTSPDQRGRLLKGQAAISGVLYLALSPLITWFLMQSDWPSHLVWWFVPILVFEHLNQELSRLLVTLTEQLTASIILFFRQGSWALLSIILMSLDSNARDLDAIMALWALAGLSAAGLGVWKLKQLKTGGWNMAIDWAWVKKGIIVSTAFLGATLALRGVQTFDRYWLEAIGGMEIVGSYVLLVGVASTLLVFLDAAVFSFACPVLIQHNHKGEHREVRKKVNVLFLQVLGFSAAFSLISCLLLPYLLAWIGNPIYLQNIYWYPWLLSAMVINALGMVPHYALYARQADRSIIYSHLASLLVFCLVTWGGSFKYSALSVAMGLNAAFTIILFWKTYAYWMLIQKDNNLKRLPFRA